MQHSAQPGELSAPPGHPAALGQCLSSRLAIVVALLNQRRLPTGRFVPKLWPCAEMREFKLRVNHDVPLAA
jgi:hypothetical protein